MPMSSIAAKSTITPLTIGWAFTNNETRSVLLSGSPAAITSDESPGMLRASQITRGVGVGQCDRLPDVMVMNTPARRLVEALGRCAGVALATLLSCSLHGCSQVSGGAVELAWSFQDYDGAPLHCVQGPLTLDTI